jgi:hypothetical protein
MTDGMAARRCTAIPRPGAGCDHGGRLQATRRGTLKLAARFVYNPRLVACPTLNRDLAALTRMPDTHGYGEPRRPECSRPAQQNRQFGQVGAAIVAFRPVH